MSTQTLETLVIAALVLSAAACALSVIFAVCISEKTKSLDSEIKDHKEDMKSFRLYETDRLDRLVETLGYREVNVQNPQFIKSRKKHGTK
jgi:hypothetical protein